MRLPCQQAGLPQSSMWDFSSIVSGCGCRSSARRRWKSFSLFLSLLLLLFSFLYSFYSLFHRITNTLVSRRQGSRIETRRSSPHRKTWCAFTTALFTNNATILRNGRRPVVFCVKHVRKDNLDYSIETSSLVEQLTPERSCQFLRPRLIIPRV